MINYTLKLVILKLGNLWNVNDSKEPELKGLKTSLLYRQALKMPGKCKANKNISKVDFRTFNFGSFDDWTNTMMSAVWLHSKILCESDNLINCYKSTNISKITQF